MKLQLAKNLAKLLLWLLCNLLHFFCALLLILLLLLSLCLVLLIHRLDDLAARLDAAKLRRICAYLGLG